MKEKIAITLEDELLASLDALVKNGVGKNRSQIIDVFLREHMTDRTSITAIIFAHDIKWDHGDYRFEKPKYLLEIEGKSVLFYQLKSMSQAWVRNVRITVEIGMSEKYAKLLDEYFPHMSIEYIEIDSWTKTWKALLIALEETVTSEYLLITNGDIYIPDLDIKDLFLYHQANKSDWTFVLKYIRTNLEKFWNVTIQWNRVEEFIEKPSHPDMFKYLTNCGCYMVTKSFYDSLVYNGEHLEIDLFNSLPKKWNILAYIYSKSWYHIQSDAEYELANGY